MGLFLVKNGVDVSTGEIVKVSTGEKKPRYFMMMMEGSLKLAKLNLSKNEYRVLLMLQSKMGYGNLLFVNKSGLAKEFECDRAMLTKTISLLVGKGLLVRIKNGYLFNKEFFVCG